MCLGSTLHILSSDISVSQVGWLVGRLVGWSVGWLVAGWVGGLQIGGLVGWLVGWMVDLWDGWIISQSIGRYLGFGFLFKHFCVLFLKLLEDII